MIKTCLTGFVVLTLLLLAGCNVISGASNSKESFSITVDSQASIVTAKPVNGVQLYLELNSATFKPGEMVMVTAGEWNTLTTSNEVAADKSWPVGRLAMGPCGTLNYPMGIAFYSGYCTESDISSAKPLRLYDPKAVYHCPAVLSSISSYVFQPSSDTADVYGSCEPEPCLDDIKVGGTLTYTGFWTDEQESTFINFTSGTYTVACGDEWGTLIILHFLVLDDEPPADNT
jgi:hypothetical protein